MMVRQTVRFLLPILLLTGAMLGHATDFRKMSGYVRTIAQREAAADRLTTRRTTDGNNQRLMAFVRIDQREADTVWLAYGCREYGRMGDIAIVSVPLSRLSELSEHPAVKRIEASPSACLTMDTTTTVINALPAYEAVATHPAFTGQGVVVGVMDVGFDLTHPNFLDTSAGQCRIGAFWDQLSKDTIGSTLPVGRDFRGYAAVREQLHSYDGRIQTHGTHTLGIAAGSGFGSPYRGVAFESDICLVSNAISSNAELIDSLDLEKYTTAVDALGFKYMFDYADSVGKPCVTSFSEGYSPYYDEDDSLYAAFLDGLSTPGHIIVASAGNESTAKTYLPKPAGQAEAGAFLNVNRKAASYRVKTNGPLWLRLYAYGDNDGTPTDTVTVTSAICQPDSLFSDTLLLGTDTCQVFALRYADTLEADTLYQVVLVADTTLNVRPVALVIEGEDCLTEVFGSSNFAFQNQSIDTRWNSATYGHNIFAPSCFPSVICVGATAHRLGFTNYEGEYKDYSQGFEQGKRSRYSSTGPTLNGTMKPDVVAPGNNIISSYSSYYLENNPEASDIHSDVAHFDYDGRTYAWNANTGTSMSAPVVAGTIALWLQANPQLTAAEVKEVFSRTCRQPDDTLTYPNCDYGFGEIDAYRGLLDILGIDKVEDISLHQPERLRISADDGQLHLRFSQQPSSTVLVRLYALSGVLLCEQSVQAASRNVTLPLPQLSADLYIVQTKSADERFTGSELIRVP